MTSTNTNFIPLVNLGVTPLCSPNCGVCEGDCGHLDVAAGHDDVKF